MKSKNYKLQLMNLQKLIKIKNSLITYESQKDLKNSYNSFVWLNIWKD